MQRDFPSFATRLWLARLRQKRGRVPFARYEVATEKDLIRHEMSQQWHDYKPRGKGNRAWRRADKLEREFRASGGFYLHDLYRGVIT